MSTAKKTTYHEVNYGQRCVVTAEGLLFSTSRLVHLAQHGYQVASRLGVSTHGIWATDNEKYGNQIMLILSNADRAIRRVRNGSSRVRSTNNQGNRTAYDVRLSTTDSIGVSVSPGPTGNNITRWTQYGRLVVDGAVNINGVAVLPVVTFFPVV